jgi:hypothetical protein
LNNGWIKLHRSLLDWEWYSDMNVRVVFIHCLLKANCKDVKYKGKDILRGSFATGLELLSRETGLTVAQIRVTLNKLKMTSEITIQTSAEGSIISITNYDLYQSNDKQNDKLTASDITNKQQTNDKPIASNNNNKKDKNEENKEKDTIVSKKKAYSESFETFWKAYCRPKDKGSKPDAFKEWQKLTESEQQKAIDSIIPYKNSQSSPEYMKHAERYLKTKAWEGITIQEETQEELEFVEAQ